jgi:hypothetical protein
LLGLLTFALPFFKQANNLARTFGQYHDSLALALR